LRYGWISAYFIECADQVLEWRRD